jgi:hypothetical protein
MGDASSLAFLSALFLVDAATLANTTGRSD